MRSDGSTANFHQLSAAPDSVFRLQATSRSAHAECQPFIRDIVLVCTFVG
jgi:hypothetical protein